METPVEILLTIHSIVRWVILLVAVVAIVKFALGWLRGGQFGGMDRGLTAGFSGLMDLQGLLGLGLLVWGGLAGDGFPLYRILHTVLMMLAIGASHQSARWKSAPDHLRYRNTLFTTLGALVLVFVGIAVLRLKAG